jgi:hypothetical protein
LTVVLLAVVAVAACAGGDDEARDTATSQTAAGSSTSTVAPTSSITEATAPLASVDWQSVPYPMDCDTVGTVPLDVVLAEPAAGVDVAVVLATCDAGAGSPPRGVFVYSPGRSPTDPQLEQTLSEDSWRTLTGAVRADGGRLTATGSTYSSTALPRCCPDGTFTTTWSWDGDRYLEESSDPPPSER